MTKCLSLEIVFYFHKYIIIPILTQMFIGAFYRMEFLKNKKLAQVQAKLLKIRLVFSIVMSFTLVTVTGYLSSCRTNILQKAYNTIQFRVSLALHSYLLCITHAYDSSIILEVCMQVARQM